MDNIIVRLIGLPGKVNGFVTVDEEMDYNIYINENLSSEMQKKTYFHELSHIKKNHLFNEMAVRDCEAEV